MSIAVAEGTYTLADLKDCVTRIILDYADGKVPDTTGCRACTQAMAGMCEEHTAQDNQRLRLEHAAVMASRAQTREDVEAAVLFAAGDLGGN